MILVPQKSRQQASLRNVHNGITGCVGMSLDPERADHKNSPHSGNAVRADFWNRISGQHRQASPVTGQRLGSFVTGSGRIGALLTVAEALVRPPGGLGIGTPEVSVSGCLFILREACIQIQTFREQMTTAFATNDFQFVLHGSLPYSGERDGTAASNPVG